MMKTQISLVVLYLAAAGAAEAAELVLKDRATLHGSVVRLGDVAEIKAAPGEQLDAERLAAQQLMPTPAPGETRYLRPSELLRMVAASGIDVQTLQFTGAESVAIGADAPVQAADCMPNHAEPLSNASADANVATAIALYLSEQTGHDRWNVRPNVDRRKAPSGLAGSPLKVTGGKAPWTGFQRFQIELGSGQPTAISAQVERVELVAFAVRPIEPGALVGAADVELRPHAGVVPAQAVASLEAIIGKEAASAIRPGAMLLANQVRAAMVVRRGERVSVCVRAAGVTVRTFATAQQDGAVGDLVMVESLAGKERYTASVTAVRELEVFAARSTATDVAGRTPADDARLR